MCLSIVWDKEKRDAYIKKLPDVVTVWKVVEATKTRYKPPMMRGYLRYYKAFNISTIRQISGYDRNPYMSGFHCFRTRTGAQAYQKEIEGFFVPKDHTQIIQGLARKTWINDIGTTLMCDGKSRYRTFVLEHIVLPRAPKQAADRNHPKLRGKK